MARGTRKPAFDSTAGLVKTFELLRNAIQPTRTLSDAGMKYFQSIINSRERSTWNELDIDGATRLSLIHCQIDDMLSILDDEGWFIFTGNGSRKRHPASQQLDALYTQRAKLIMQLGLTAGNRSLTQASQVKKNRNDQNAQNASQRAEDSNGILA